MKVKRCGALLTALLITMASVQFTQPVYAQEVQETENAFYEAEQQTAAEQERTAASDETDAVREVTESKDLQDFNSDHMADMAESVMDAYSGETIEFIADSSFGDAIEENIESTENNTGESIENKEPDADDEKIEDDEEEAEEEEETEKLTAESADDYVRDLKLGVDDEENPTTVIASFHGSTEKDYAIHVYRSDTEDGKKIKIGANLVFHTEEEDGYFRHDLWWIDFSTGFYSYRLKVLDQNEVEPESVWDLDFDKGIVSDYSETFYYEKPQQKLSALLNPVWNDDTKTFSWEYVTDEKEYISEITVGCETPSEQTSWRSVSDTDTQSVSFLDSWESVDENYSELKIQVNLFSSNIFRYSPNSYVFTIRRADSDICDDGRINMFIQPSGEVKVDWGGPVGTHHCTVNLYRRLGNGFDERVYYSMWDFSNDTIESFDTWDAQLHYLESGTYYATLTIEDDPSSISDYNGLIYQSADFVFNRPAQRIATPDNFRITERDGHKLLEWDQIEENNGYDVHMTNRTTRHGKWVLFEKDTNHIYIDYWYLDEKPYYTGLGAGEWKFDIIAISDNINAALPSEAGVYTAEISGIKQIKATSLSLSQTAATLYTDDADGITLTPSLLPSNVTFGGVIWKSSNENIATVTQNKDGSATVKPIKNGTVKITATTADGSNKSAACTVTVKTKVTEVTLPDTGKIAVNKTLALTPKFNGEVSDPSDKSLQWFSSNSSVATVSQKGVVTAKSTGEVKIWARSVDGDIESNVCTVTVYEPVTAVTLNAKAVSLGTGDSYLLKATTTPVTATSGEITFTPSSDEYLTVTDHEDGTATITAADTLPTGVSSLQVTVSAKANDGSEKSATCKVTIGQKVTNVSVSAKNNQVILAKGKTLQLSAAIEPKTAANKAITWSSSDSSVATVDARGKVTALAPGDVTITAANEVSGEEDTYEIKTYIPLSKLTLNAKSLTLHTDKSYQLSATLTPADATIREGDAIEQASDHVTYEVIEGEDWLDVDEATGLLTAKTVETGKPKSTAKVQVTAHSDGNITNTAICTVTVVGDEVPVKSVKLSTRKLSMGIGSQASVLATIAPVTADNQTLQWASSDPDIATVENGVIQALAAGRATITAETTDGSKKKATVTVAVGNPVDHVKIDAKAVSRLIVGKSITIKASAKDEKGNKPANTTLTWSITSAKDADGTDADPDTIATINAANGKVTAKSAGTVTIRVTAETPSEGSAKYAEHTLTTYVPISKLSVSRTKATIGENAEGVLWITALTPVNATDQTILWESSNEAVVKLVTDDAAYAEASDEDKENYLDKTTTKTSTETLRYQAVGAGTAKITGTAGDGSKKKVTVTIKVNGIMKQEDVKLNIRTVPNGITVQDGTNNTAAITVTSMPVKKTLTLTPVLTATAVDKSVTYVSSHPDVATVTAKGVVTAKQAGSATITMRTADGGYTATCLITVP